MYDGPFLDGLTTPDPAFESWVAATRTELHDLACDAFGQAVDRAADENDPDTAIELARRLVSLDPLREDGHRRLMMLLHANGDRTEALRQYHIYADVLKNELQVAPDAATTALFEKIRADTTSSIALDMSVVEPQTPSVKTPSPQPPLAENPFIAVLPFDNLSDDPEQQFFADGITEDIITGLSRFPNLYVVDRNSIFTYKRRAADVRQVSEDFGVRYIVEGSVRRGANRVRVSSQLIDAETGNHIWTERYDRDVADLFSMQDDITESVISSTAPEITSAEWDRKARVRSNNVSAYDQALKAIWQIREGYFSSNPVLRNQGLELAQHVVERDSKCLEAWMALTYYYAVGVVLGAELPRSELLQRAQETAQRQLELDPFDYRALHRLGVTKTYLGRVNEGLSDLERAIKINPGGAEVLGALAWSQARVGLLDEALNSAEQALRLSPRNPNVAGGAFFGKAIVAYLREDYETAADFAREAIYMQPFAPMRYRILACSLLHLGQSDTARTTITELERRRPEFVDHLLNGEYRVFTDDKANEQYIATLRSLRHSRQ